MMAVRDSHGIRTLLLAIFLVGLCVLPLAAGHNADKSDFEFGLDARGLPIGPSQHHWLGTDRLFRDLGTRLALGTLRSIGLSLAATTLACTVAVVLGVAAGYWGKRAQVGLPWGLVPLCLAGAVLAGVRTTDGLLLALALGVFSALAARARLNRWAGHARLPSLLSLDSLLVRIMEASSAMPFLVIALTFGAAIDKPTVATTALVLGLTGWVSTARIVRTRVMQLAGADFIIAARALGASEFGIVRRHILPNIAPTVMVSATTLMGSMILAESALSFLGVGSAPPAPSLGHMLFEGQDYLDVAPWLIVGPAASLMAVVLLFDQLTRSLQRLGVRS